MATVSRGRGYPAKRWGTLLTSFLIGALVGVGSLVVIPTADAYKIDGKRWPGRTITYHDSTNYKWSVKQAVAAWNTSGARIRFVPTTPARAQVRIRQSPYGGIGFASVKRYGGVNRAGVVLLPRYVHRYTQVHIAAHELGHILGLGHEDRHCASMNSKGNHAGNERLCYPAGTPSYPPSVMWRCRILEADDIRGAVRLYGGGVRPVREPATCWFVTAPDPPTELTATTTGPDAVGAASIRLQWRNPTSAGFANVAISRGLGSCPAKLYDARYLGMRSGAAEAGAVVSTEDGVFERGRYCYGIWALTKHELPSTPVYVWVTN